MCEDCADSQFLTNVVVLTKVTGELRRRAQAAGEFAVRSERTNAVVKTRVGKALVGRDRRLSCRCCSRCGRCGRLDGLTFAVLARIARLTHAPVERAVSVGNTRAVKLTRVRLTRGTGRSSSCCSCCCGGGRCEIGRADLAVGARIARLADAQIERAVHVGYATAVIVARIGLTSERRRHRRA